MSNARRSIAQLRAEKEAGHQDGPEGIRSRTAVSKAHNKYNNSSRADPSMHAIYLTALLEKAKRGCALLEHFPDPLERAYAHEIKAF